MALPPRILAALDETSGADGVLGPGGRQREIPYDVLRPHTLQASPILGGTGDTLNAANLLPLLCLTVGQADDLTHLQPDADLDSMAPARLTLTVSTFWLNALPSKSVPKIRTRTRISLRGSRRVAMGEATNLFLRTFEV